MKSIKDVLKEREKSQKTPKDVKGGFLKGLIMRRILSGVQVFKSIFITLILTFIVCPVPVIYYYLDKSGEYPNVFVCAIFFIFFIPSTIIYIAKNVYKYVTYPINVNMNYGDV